MEDYLTGPVEGKLKHRQTGQEFVVDLYMCNKCKHIRKMFHEGNDETSNMTQCLYKCEGCVCDRRI